MRLQGNLMHHSIGCQINEEAHRPRCVLLAMADIENENARRKGMNGGKNHQVRSCQKPLLQWTLITVSSSVRGRWRTSKLQRSGRWRNHTSHRWRRHHPRRSRSRREWTATHCHWWWGWNHAIDTTTHRHRRLWHHWHRWRHWRCWWLEVTSHQLYTNNN